MWVYHLKSWYNRVYQIILSLVLIFPVYADIVTDGTVGNAQALTGPNFTIPENLGSRAGANLFHSFQRFNIFQGESATFTGSNSIANVISRVTGGQASTINGLLQSKIGQEGFYFINPAGVMFGANAEIHVPSSFYVSTADELRFPDGAVFSATNPAASTLSIDKPQSFGFLGDQTAKIDVVDSTLVLKPGKTLSLSGGALAIDGSTLFSEAGEIQLVAAGDAVTAVTVDGELSQPAQGDLSVLNSLIVVTGNGAGRLVVRGGPSEMNSSSLLAGNNGTAELGSDKAIDIRAISLEVVDSLISTNTLGPQPAANISIHVADKLTLVKGGQIDSTTFASGNAGEVTVKAGQLRIDDEGSDFVTGITSETRSSGNAGTLNVIITDQLSVLNEGQISSITRATGDSGTVNIKAGQLLIDSQEGGATGITTAAEGKSTGNAGTVTVMVTGKLAIVHESTIDSSTFARGNAGAVTVNAGDLLIDGQPNGDIFDTGIFSSARSNSSRNAGTVTVTVTDKLVVNTGLIDSSSFGAGHAGDVIVDADQLSIVNGVVGSNTFASGEGGRVTVKARRLVIGVQGLILSLTGFDSSGNAGTVTVTVTDKLIINGLIDSSTLGAGDAGAVTVKAGNIVIDNQGGSEFFSGIGSRAGGESSGQAGTVTLDTQNLSIFNGGKISIQSFPTVDAATLANIQPTQININAENITLSNSSITTESSGNVPAGSITLNVADTLSLDPSIISTAANNADGGAISIRAKVIDLQDSQITTSVSGQGDGGDINLDTDVLVLDSGFIQANTNGINAIGGDIRINTNALVASNNNLLTGGDTPLSFQPGLNVIQAAAPDGISGNIDITTPQLDISGDLIDLDSALLNVDDLAQNPCATTGGKQSTLVSLGRGGLPESPEQAGSIVITPERLQRLLPRPKTITDPESGSLHPETTRYKGSAIESKTWLAWLDSPCL